MGDSNLSDRLPWIAFVVGSLFLVTFLLGVTGLTIEPPRAKRFKKVATVEAFEQESLGDFFKTVAKTQLLRNCAAYDAFQCDQAAACVMCGDSCVPGTEDGPERQSDRASCSTWSHLGVPSTSQQYGEN